MSYRRLTQTAFFLFLTATFIFIIGGSGPAAALPGSAVDESKVPHYFGPYPNWANSPFTLPDAVVSITGGGGSGAAAVATVGTGGIVTGISITNPGSGYTAAPSVGISGSGSGATAVAVFSPTGAVTSVSVNTPGAGYTNPQISISGDGVNATATVYGGVDQVTLAAPVGGYMMPTVDFDLPDDPDGVQARGHTVCIEVNCLPSIQGGMVTVTGVVVDEPGSGYSFAPGVAVLDGTRFHPMHRRGPAAVVTATLAITQVKMNTFGSGYSTASAVISDTGGGTGIGATATAIVQTGAITAINVTSAGSGYITTDGMRKFIDPLPNLCNPAGVVGDPISPCPTDSSKYLPLAVADTTSFADADSYVIALVQYLSTYSSDLPPALTRGYVQIETAQNAGISQHFPLYNVLLNGSQVPVLDANGTQVYALTPPQYLGPVIAATKNKPVRIIFHNYLPTGSDGDLFLPVDTTYMGAGPGPIAQPVTVDNGTVMDGARNPVCGEQSNAKAGCFADNRATQHLHGGITPWISDGTPHQWVTPAGENTPWPQGVSVENVPDMNACQAEDDGCMTFYYTNQQSARFMFYHDHAWGITRLNVYAGEAAGYIIADSTEQKLITSGTIPADQIPLVIQDKTFVPGPVQLAAQDPTWDVDRWGGLGSQWSPHVYMPAQNPGDPTGMSAFGRWMYGPWFWPPSDAPHGPIDNPYYNMDPNANPPFSQPLAVPCDMDNPATWQYDTDPFCEPAKIPGTPNNSMGMEAFNDTPVVNGTAYPTLTVEPKSYRLRILNAANDRFFNLQWYVGDISTASTALNTMGQPIGATEVALNAGEVAAAQTDPVIFPTPDQILSPAGPDWIQIGTEGGFLPAPVIVDGQQVTTWITDPTRFDVGNVDMHSLLVAPAERADAIVDFSQFAGKTLILYNDAPAAFPARVPSYDYYTGAPDLRPVGAPTILPGYGPNTRTIMQIKVSSGTPAPAFDFLKLANAFRHKANGTGVFESGQHPIIVGQAAYNSAYGTNFVASGWCNAPGSTSTNCDGFARISEQGGDFFGFNTLNSNWAPGKGVMKIPLQPKAIHDETNAVTFDEYGRMQAAMGLEAPGATPLLQNIILYPYINPASEIIDATNLPVNLTPDIKITPISSATDGTQIWKITHNGVDTHPIHWHLYDLQLINRVTWDNIIIPPDPTELGWKDTIRISPLEDTLVALRPIIPTFPFEVPNSVRPLNPMMPLGSTIGYNNTDMFGNPTSPISNVEVNFGWEYVFHCHILSHEENDMMRPVSVAIPPIAPSNLTAVYSGSGNSRQVVLNWVDNSITETSFSIVRSLSENGPWTTLATLGPDVTTFSYLILQDNTPYFYKVLANNEVGYTGVAGYSHLVVHSESFVAQVGGMTTQTIKLQPGWNLVSSYIEAANPAMSSITAGVPEVTLVKDGAGQIYWASYGVDQIGSWNTQNGYQFYATKAVNLNITGVITNAQQIDTLVAGWNMVSYRPILPMPVADALASISAQLVLVKDDQGRVYWPAMGINGIGNMQPGIGYQINMSAPGALSYPVVP